MLLITRSFLNNHQEDHKTIGIDSLYNRNNISIRSALNI